MSVASGATPTCTPLLALPLPAAIPDTAVPWPCVSWLGTTLNGFALVSAKLI